MPTNAEPTDAVAPAILTAIWPIVASFTAVVAGLILWLVIAYGAAVGQQPLFLISVPMLAFLTVMLVTLRGGTRQAHGIALTWAAFVAAWALFYMRVRIDGRYEAPDAVAISLFLGSVLMTGRHFVGLVTATAISVAVLDVAGGLPLVAARSSALFTVTMIIVASFVWQATHRERRIRSEAMLQAERDADRLTAVLRGVPDGLIALNAEGKADVYNRGAAHIVQELFGGMLEHGKAPLNQMPEHIKEQMTPLLDAGLPQRTATVVCPEAKATVEVSSFQTPEGDWILALHDVTAQVALRQRLKTVEVEARQSVLNMVSHRINTPLTPALLTASRMLMPNAPQEVGEFRDAMMRIQEKLQETIQAVQDLIVAPATDLAFESELQATGPKQA